MVYWQQAMYLDSSQGNQDPLASLTATASDPPSMSEPPILKALVTQHLTKHQQLVVTSNHLPKNIKINANLIGNSIKSSTCPFVKM